MKRRSNKKIKARSSKTKVSPAKKRKPARKKGPSTKKARVARPRTRGRAFKKALPPAAVSDVAMPADPSGMTCSDGWQVTGYYTPVESDFHGSPQQIQVAGQGSDQFPRDFLKAVRMEGWGRTRHGWFLGYYNGGYHSSDAPLSARGKPLQIGSLAVDRHEIPFGTYVRITNLPAPWDTQRFVSDDVGSMINHRHVDVYCGFGASARAETFRITGNGRRLCQGQG